MIKKILDHVKNKIDDLSGNRDDSSDKVDLSTMTSEDLKSEIAKRDVQIQELNSDIEDYKNNFRKKCVDYFTSRRSIRRYSTRPIDYEKIYDIIQAGLNAPVAGNIQNYRIILIQDKAEKTECARIAYQQFWMTNAPYFLVVTRDDTEVEDLYPNRGEVFSIQNVAAVIENMIMAAHMSDLGACWVGVDDSEALKDFLGIPRHMHLDAIIPVGYAEGNPDKMPKNAVETMLYYEKFGNKSR